MKQIKGFMFTSNHRDYFQNHDLTGIPPEFVSRIGELGNARYIDDIMVIFHLIEQLGRESQEYIYRLTNKYILTAIPAWEDALNRGVEFRLLEPTDIVIPPEFERGPVIGDAVNSGQFQVRKIDEVNVFLALNAVSYTHLTLPTTPYV